MRTLAVLIGIFTIVLSTQENATNINDVPSNSTQASNGTTSVAEAGVAKTENDAGLQHFRIPKLIAKTTITLTDVTLATSTVFSLCVYSVALSPRCSGKRKRRYVVIDPITGERKNAKNVELSTSIGKPDAVKELEFPTPKKGKFGGMTYVSVNRVATTLTIISTDTSTTVSLAFACVVGGIHRPVNSCSGR